MKRRMNLRDYVDNPQCFDKHPRARTQRELEREDNVVILLTMLAVVVYFAVTLHC